MCYELKEMSLVILHLKHKNTRERNEKLYIYRKHEKTIKTPHKKLFLLRRIHHKVSKCVGESHNINLHILVNFKAKHKKTKHVL